MKLTITILLLLTTCHCHAQGTAEPQPKQYNNYAVIHGGAFWVTNSKQSTYSLLSMIGGSYYRRVYQRIHAVISYSQWQESLDNRLNAPHFVRQNFAQESYNQGKIYTRTKYKMIDLGGLYELPLSAQHHSAFAGLGISRYWGINNYITSYFIKPHPVYDGIDKKEQYWGSYIQASYRYSFWHNRIAAGATLKLRYFFQQLPIEHNYLLYVGIGF